MKIAHRLIAGFIALILTVSAKGQDLYKAAGMLKTKPLTALETAKTYTIDPAGKDAAYQRFLKLYILLYQKDLADSEKVRYVDALIGQEVSTLIFDGRKIKPEGKAGYQYMIKNSSGTTINVIANPKKKVDLSFDSLSFYTLQGKVKSIEKIGQDYTVRMDVRSSKIVGGRNTVSAKEWDKLFDMVQKGKFNIAADESKELMDRYLIDVTGQAARLRYIYLYSLAGMAAKQQISFDSLEKIVSSFKNQNVIMPTHPVMGNAGNCINHICIGSDSAHLAYTLSASGKSVLIRESISSKEPLNLSRLLGLSAYTGGIIKSIKVNPAHTTDWIIDLEVSPGFVMVDE